MAYIDIETYAYPLTEQDIRNEYPNVSFPEPFVAPPKYQWVFDGARPDYDAATQGVRQLAPAPTDKGHWEAAFEVYDLDADTIAANQAAADAQRKAAIKAEIAALDLRRIRPLAEGDTEYLATLNAQIAALRAQL